MESLAGVVALGTAVLYGGAIYLAIRLLFTLRQVPEDAKPLSQPVAGDRG